MKDFFNQYYNYVLFAAVLSWCAAQLIKTIIYFLIKKEFNSERLFGAGGFPSSHSATVCAATIAMARKVGPASPEFAIIFILALIVMYDAMGVRRAAGMHAKAINKMNRDFFDKNLFEEKSTEIEIENEKENDDKICNKELKEFLGHTPFEVVGGALLGILIALFVQLR